MMHRSRLLPISLALLLAAPARAQQPELVCTAPNVVTGEITCRREQATSGKRLAIVAAAMVVTGVVVYLIVRHRHHKMKIKR